MARAQIVERLLAFRHVVEHVVLEAALQKVIRERAEQVFHAHFAGRIGNVLAVANAFHKNSRWSSVFESSATITCCSVRLDDCKDRRLIS